MLGPKNPGVVHHKQSRFTEEFFKQASSFEISIIDDFFATKPNEVEEKKLLENLSKINASELEIYKKLSKYILPWIALTAVAHCFKFKGIETVDTQTDLCLYLVESGFFEKEQNLSNFNLTHLDKKALESIVKKYGNNKPIINLILVNYFHKFQNLDEESARILLDYGLGIFVIQGSNLGKFGFACSSS
jgi:hypothetical protein